MPPRRACIGMFLLPPAFLIVALLAASPGRGAAETGEEEVRRLEASLRNMEDFLRLRQLEEAGKDPETIRLTQKAQWMRQHKDDSYAMLMKVRDIQRRARKDPTATPDELAQVDSLVRQAENDWNQADQDWTTAESNLAVHRHNIQYVRSRDVPIPMVRQQCESLRSQLAAARQRNAAPTVHGPPPPLPDPPPTTSWSGENIVLSGEQARDWLRRNGYLAAGDVPTSRWRDWHSRSHSALDGSGHPLQGLSGEYYFSGEGRLMGSIHIMVRPGTVGGGSVQTRDGGVSGGGGGRPPAQAPVDEASRNALLAKIREYHKRWYAAWCRKMWSGCAVVPNGARDELLQWTKNATKQGQVDRLGRLLDCYNSCVMQRPTNEGKVNQCRRLCKENTR